jgi:hypothetical protein
MPQIYCVGDEPLNEFMDRIDWDFVKKVTISKDLAGYFKAEITHYRSGRYMLHSFKCGRKSA